MSQQPFTPSETDKYIATRLQLRRSMMGFSQKDLAAICGVTFQQIQKYETAGNRISSSRLFELSKALSTPISFFFRGLPGFVEETRYRYGRMCSPAENDPLSKNESLSLVHMYWKLPSDEHRKLVIELIKALGGTPPQPEEI